VVQAHHGPFGGEHELRVEAFGDESPQGQETDDRGDEQPDAGDGEQALQMEGNNLNLARQLREPLLVAANLSNLRPLRGIRGLRAKPAPAT
jgi:hypothetical protein